MQLEAIRKAALTLRQGKTNITTTQLYQKLHYPLTSKTALRIKSYSISSISTLHLTTARKASALNIPKAYHHTFVGNLRTLNPPRLIFTLSRNDSCNPLICPRWIQARYYVDKIIYVPKMAESISEEVGDFVKEDEELVSIETDKVDVPVNSPYTGKIVEIYANEEDNVEIDGKLLRLELGDAPADAAPEAPKDTKAEPREEPKETKAEPREEPKETKLEPREEPKKEEPKKEEPPTPHHAKTPPAPTPKSAPTPQPTAPTQAAISKSPYGDREERRVKMNRMRLRISERLKESQNTAASLTTFNEIDMTNLMDLRNSYKDTILKKYGVKIGFMSAFVKASVFALQEIPVVNATIEGPNGGDTIVYKDYVDLSVAVATPKGLVTPILRNAHAMASFVEIEKAIAELGQKARDGKLSIEDMAGGTFTISNGGVYGSLYGTPIINLPQSAILGMHAVKERAVAINGQVEVRPMMYIALTYDHRLIDGREAVTFLKTVKEQVEDPRRLLLGI
ncbi:5099_t:CDS:10 [Ambispora gerdemannii]|uniref:dihydrolipoyllysine-residue succinyltransferase n=1 Tax=Ambispora gerdemannii TaxID=144530 RepID=A0A9N9G0D0_9GLOM|nr:5099_t:CDS:10 [Ambispora gerdemannii]